MKYTQFLAILLIVLIQWVSFGQCATVTPQLTASQPDFCGPGAYTVNLTNISTGANANLATTYYFWSVNGVVNDTTNTLSAPADINVTTAGTYTVQVRAIDSTTLCTDSTSLNVVVHPIPSAAFSFNNDNTCPGTTINFSNSSTGADGYTVYSWDFGDGGS